MLFAAIFRLSLTSQTLAATTLTSGTFHLCTWGHARGRPEQSACCRLPQAAALRRCIQGTGLTGQADAGCAVAQMLSVEASTCLVGPLGVVGWRHTCLMLSVAHPPACTTKNVDLLRGFDLKLQKQYGRVAHGTFCGRHAIRGGRVGVYEFFSFSLVIFDA